MLYKFQLRAWDEKTKTMYFPYSIHFDSANNISYVKDIYMKERRDLILMEFTGLYVEGNNGHFHKIFERDIIEIAESLFVVERYNGAFGYYASDKRMGFIPFVNHNYIKISEKGVMEGVNLKGNVYEDSALITLCENAKISSINVSMSFPCGIDKEGIINEVIPIPITKSVVVKLNKPTKAEPRIEEE